MLADFIAWWTARIAELLPASWMRGSAGTADAVVIEAYQNGEVTALRRHKGRVEPIGLGAAARLAAREPVVLRPAAGMVLEKRYTVPTAPRRDLDQMLRHDLSRVTPFPAQALYWRWDGRPKPADRSRLDIVLTMVPKTTVAAALETLADAGIAPGAVEVDAGGHCLLLPMADQDPSRSALLRGLAWGCAGLAVVSLILPFVLQAVALQSVNTQIADLHPALTQVEALRRGIVAGNAGREVLAREAEHTADVLQVLATLTRILPDDTFLTDFVLRDRHFTISGRSASAPRLITGLAADQTIRNAAFAAPVTRIEGTAADAFSIGGDIVP